MIELISAILIGLGFGILLQKGRFCFTSAFRDFFAYKDTRVLRGVLAGILAMVGGVSLAYSLGTPIDRFWLPSFGLSSVVGGFVFGVGMVLAGGCASGTLYRAAQGYVHFWLVLAFTAVGYVSFAALFESVFLAFYFDPLQVFAGGSAFLLFPRGFAPFLGGGVIIAVALAYRAIYLGARSLIPPTSSGGIPTPSIDSRVHSLGTSTVDRRGARSLLSVLGGGWNTTICGIALGLLASAWFVLWNTWSITTPEVRWVGLALSTVLGQSYIESQPYWNGVVFAAHGITISLDMVMLVALVAGAFLASLWSSEFRIRKPVRKSLPNIVAGGLLMGFGSRMTPGCNISNAFGGLGILSLSSAVATLGLLLGIYAGTYWVYRHVGCAI
jgi:uncharacterized membrane protein YedE/YeeE